MHYAGVGSTKTPKDIQKLMKFIAQILSIGGWVLNSGAAPGADSAFESGAVKKNIFLPYRYFNKSISDLYLDNLDPDLVEISKQFVFEYHPNPYALMKKGGFGFKAMTRNSFQVLGIDHKTHVKFTVCWTKDGGLVGGTAHAIKISRKYDIPVYNLFFEEDYKKLYDSILRDILKKTNNDFNESDFEYHSLIKRFTENESCN